MRARVVSRLWQETAGVPLSGTAALSCHRASGYSTSVSAPTLRRYHIWYSKTMAWSVETLNDTVDAELTGLPVDMRARFVRIAELIEAVGLPNVREPHVRHVRGPVWEIRLKGASGITRALYVAAHSQRVVVVRVFVKKTTKTPASEIEIALRRARELDV